MRDFDALMRDWLRSNAPRRVMVMTMPDGEGGVIEIFQAEPEMAKPSAEVIPLRRTANLLLAYVNEDVPSAA